MRGSCNADLLPRQVIQRPKRFLYTYTELRVVSNLDNVSKPSKRAKPNVMYTIRK